MAGRHVRLWRPFARAGWAIALVTVIACGGGDGEAPDAGSESARSPEPEWVVPTRVVHLRVGPDPEAGSVTRVATGTALERVDATSDPPGWVRVATWDGRRGWVDAEAVVSPAVWAHYERAFGGLPPSELRPAYPVAGGWLVEIPYGSPSFYQDASAFVLADSTRRARVTRIGTVTCAGATHRVAWLDGGRSDETLQPELDRARIALPAGRTPTVRGLTVEPVSEPDSTRVDAVTRAVERLEARADHVTWWRIDGGSVWATVEWTSDGPREAAFVALPPAAGEEGIEVRTVVAPRSRDERRPGTDGPALRPVFAYATNGTTGPTLFVVSSNDYDRGRTEMYFARPDGYGRLWTGYAWSCGG